jgi:hypothetical protein
MKKLVYAIVLLMLSLSWATPALAQDGDGEPGQVVFGRNVTVEAGQAINDDVVIFGGNLTVEEGGRINGNAVVFGGNGDIQGEIDGDAAFIGGNAMLGSKARVEGDLATVGGQAELDEGAYVRGDVIETTTFDFRFIPALPAIRAVPPRPYFDEDFRFDPFQQFFAIMLAAARGLIVALVVSAIGLLAVLFMPEHTRVVGQTIRQAAPASFGVGLLTLIVGGLALVLLFITCCLAPLGLLAGLALVVAGLYGWIVVGYLLGLRMLRALQKDREPTATAAALAGVFTVTLIHQGLMALSHLPCLGFFFWLLAAGLWLVVASVGLGAVVLTRFGTQPYDGTAALRTPPPPPALPPSPPPPRSPEPPEALPDVETQPEPPDPEAILPDAPEGGPEEPKDEEDRRDLGVGSRE